MKLPKNMTEDEVTEIITKIAKRYAYRFRFGFYDEDEVFQEACVLGLEALEKYDEDRPLENFLARHVYNRLCNLKRNKYERRETPCLKCPFDAWIKEKCVKYDDMMECKWYSRWFVRNTAKKNLMAPCDLETVAIDSEKNMFEGCENEVVANDELMEIIDKELPLDMRADFLRLKHGASVPKQRRDEILAKIREILSV